MYHVKHAVVLFIFIRLDSVLEILSVLSQVKPPRLYLIGEGYRPNRLGEDQRVLLIRDTVKKAIDWPCEVYENFVEIDIGAGRRISTGISWVFEHEESAIFIEDDVIPSLSFFQFCDEMLDMYHNHPEIMAISGNNVIPDYPIASSYTFSSIPFVWGWASWKRAWEGYDYHISNWPEIKKSKRFKKLFENPRFYEMREHEFDLAYRGIDFTWDYQWQYHLLMHQGMCIVPKTNLVRNVGIGSDATNTKEEQPMKGRVEEDIHFPLVHPEVIHIDHGFDEYYFRNYLFSLYYTDKSSKIKYHIGRILGYKASHILRQIIKRNRH